MTRAVAVFAAAAALAAAAAGCGGSTSATGSGDIRWKTTPKIVINPDLPNDRILTGTIRNDSLKPIYLAAHKFQVLDRDGRSLHTAALLLQTFAHGLYPPSQVRSEDTGYAEQLRTGQAIALEPGKEVPVTVSWTRPPGKPAAQRISYGGGTLPVPG